MKEDHSFKNLVEVGKTLKETISTMIETIRENLILHEVINLGGVYVVDTDTFEIVFVNDTLKKELGVDPTGGTCYSAFQGRKSKCPFCPHDRIKGSKGEPIRWTHINELTKEPYLLIDKYKKFKLSENSSPYFFHYELSIKLDQDLVDNINGIWNRTLQRNI